MEVHHSHGHGGKKFTDYLAEFVMIFLAVTAGFFAETLREHMSDNKKESEYMRSLVADLREDTAQINRVTTVLLRNVNGQDSLINLLKNYTDNDSINKKAYKYYLTYTISVPQVFFNERTLTQLLASGSMRLITHHHTSDSIMDYNNIVKAVKLQGDYYNEQFKRCFYSSIGIFDFSITSSPMQKDFKRHLFIPPSTKFVLISKDPLELKKYSNELTMLESIINGYILNLHATKLEATHLISLLHKEYDIDKD